MIFLGVGSDSDRLLAWMKPTAGELLSMNFNSSWGYVKIWQISMALSNVKRKVSTLLNFSLILEDATPNIMRSQIISSAFA